MRYNVPISRKAATFVLIFTLTFVLLHLTTASAQKPDMLAGEDFAYSSFPSGVLTPPPAPAGQTTSSSSQEDDQSGGIFAGIGNLLEALFGIFKAILRLFGIGSDDNDNASEANYESHSTTIDSNSNSNGHFSTTKDVISSASR